MGEFVHVYNDGGGIRNVYAAEGIREVLGGKGAIPNVSDSVILNVGTPFAILPGDGATVGLNFTGSAGAFTLSAAVLANSWNALKGVWCWLPANFGGSAYPAGWYWAVFSSDTAGVMYMDKYVSGIPVRPVTPTPFPINLNGRITQSLSEITGPTGYSLAGGALGPNGCLKTYIRGIGTTTNNKTYRVYLGATVIVNLPLTTNPSFEFNCLTANQGAENLQSTSRTSGLSGVGLASATMAASEATAIDTGTAQSLSVSLQINNTASSVILLHADITATYGA